jgi:hypothetical protein
MTSKRAGTSNGNGKGDGNRNGKCNGNGEMRGFFASLRMTRCVEAGDGTVWTTGAGVGLELDAALGEDAALVGVFDFAHLGDGVG